MRYLIINILICIAANCFAMDQKLAGGMEGYEAAVKDLRKIEIKLETANEAPKYWLKKLNEERGKSRDGIFYSFEMVKFYQDKVGESNRRIKALSVKYVEAKDTVKKLEPIKKEYDKQVVVEHKQDRMLTVISEIAGMSIIPLVVILILWVSIRRQKKYKRLLKEGKITKEEYDQEMQSPESSIFSSGRINPATGLPMTGEITDVGGNVRGSSDYTGHDYSREYRERHRWDDHVN